jgi:hypothetical protein
LRVGCGLSLTETGWLFERDRTTVAHACGVIEGRCDDPIFDRAPDLLEWVVPALTTRPFPPLHPASRGSMPAGTKPRGVRPCANISLTPTKARSPWLRRRKNRSGEAMISQSQFDAGERLRADFWFAQTPRTTINWSSLSPMQRGRRHGAARASGADMLDNAAAAAERRAPRSGGGRTRAMRGADRRLLPLEGS